MGPEIVGTETENLTGLIRKEVPGVLAIYRFGSRETGNAGPESDTDLAVLSDHALPPLILWGLSEKLALFCWSEVDLVDLRPASAVMRMQVIAHGKRIYCADIGICEQFEDFVYSDSARLNEERHAILQDIRERGSVYSVYGEGTLVRRSRRFHGG